MKTSHSQIGGLSAADTRQPTVLVMLHLGDYGTRMLTGIREYADAAGWHLQTVEYSRAARPTCPARPPGVGRGTGSYSHSMVAGGLEEMS